MDKGRDINVIHLDFCKAFDMVALNILLSKLRWIQQVNLSRWIKNWFNGCTIPQDELKALAQSKRFGITGVSETL